MTLSGLKATVPFAVVLLLTHTFGLSLTRSALVLLVLAVCMAAVWLGSGGQQITTTEAVGVEET